MSSRWPVVQNRDDKTRSARIAALVIVASFPFAFALPADLCRIDADGDAICDRADNCRTTWNPDQADIFPETIVQQDQYSASVHEADLDGDGDLDLVWGYWGIYWNENARGGRFVAALEIDPGGSFIDAMAVGDLDGDGDTDVVAVFEGDERVIWFENLGAGSFGPRRTIYDDITTVWTIAIGDLDGDGRNDVVWADVGSNDLLWTRSLRGGHFGPAQRIGSPIDPREVLPVDLDLDGDSDVLVIFDFGRTIGWYENLGQGVFDRPRTISDGFSADSIVATDLDGDGDPDLVAAAASGSAYDVVWFENLGNGTFGEVRGAGNAAGIPENITAADLDLDGDPDILLSTWADAALHWFPNLGSGEFGPAETIADGLGGSRPPVATGDLNGDGRPDVIGARYSLSLDSRIVWFANVLEDGAGNACDVCPAEWDPAQNDSDHDGLGDACDNCRTTYNPDQNDTDLDGGGDSCTHDRDGDDVADEDDNCPDTANTDQAQSDSDAPGDACDNCPFLPNPAQDDSDGDGLGDSCDDDSDDDGVPDGDDNCPTRFNPSQQDTFQSGWITSGENFAFNEVLTADLDGDGDSDVLWWAREEEYYEDFLGWNRNLGDGRFGINEDYIVKFGSVRAPFAADLDNDGDIDVGWYDRGIQWRENLGDGHFSGRPTLIDDYVVDILPADLDGDGDADLLAIHSSATLWFENLGSGMFSASHPIGGGAGKMLAVDLDGDTDLDVVTSGSESAVLIAYANSGDGEFAAARELTATLAAPSDLAAADLDGDGDIDLVTGIRAVGTGDETRGEVAWYENLDGESFGPPRELDDRLGVVAVEATDVDLDGDTDLMSTSLTYVYTEQGEFSRGSVDWYENLGEGRFAPAESASTHSAQSIVAADIHGDARPELLTAFPYSANWLNWTRPDGAGAACDNCRLDWNPGQRDPDGDGFGNVCDVCPSIPNPDQLEPCRPDTDLDYVPDNDDVCPLLYNPDQREGFAEQLVPTTTERIRELIVADLDGDRDDDLVVSAEPDDLVGWFENRGGGTFGPLKTIFFDRGEWARGLVAADIDGDGDLDLLFPYFGAHLVEWWENPGTPVRPWRPHFVTDLVGGDHVSAGDLDGDGDADVVVSTRLGTDRIVWYENLGDDVFGPERRIAVGIDDPEPLPPVDLDGDGDLDIVSLPDRRGLIVWYANDGSGLFGEAQPVHDAVNRIDSIVATDLDEDGDQDLLWGSKDERELAWHENPGDGRFLPARVISSDPNKGFITTGHLEPGGGVDIVMTSPVARYMSRGNGTFGPKQATAYWGGMPYIMDLDGDDRPEIVTIRGSDIVILWNHPLDGIGDACDNCPSDVNPDQHDSDHDGVGNVCDNCPRVFNPNQLDVNGDGLGDACGHRVR